MSTTAARQVKSLYRHWQRICRRLLRKGAGVGVIALLWLGLIEPLACIVHCDLWTLLHLSPATGGSANQHHMHASAAQPAEQRATHTDAPSHQLFGAAPIAAAGDHTHCALMGADQSPTDGVPQTVPAPFHEMFVASAIVVLLAAPMLWHRASAHPPPPRRIIRPPLRPPILCF